MANGKPGDHPLTDIVIHGRAVYSPEADRLVREIAAHGGRDQIADVLLLESNEFANLDISKLEGGSPRFAIGCNKRQGSEVGT